jgi:hypothetical protein
MLRIADTGAILNLEAYLFGVASNVAMEHGALERRHGTTVDIDDATVGSRSRATGRMGRSTRAMVARLPRCVRSRETRNGRPVPARPQPHDIAASGTDAHEEIRRPGAWALPAPLARLG